MPTLHSALRVLTPLLLVLSLAGCFKSSQPLVDAAQAKYPFNTITLKNDEGGISIVKRDGDVYRFIEDGKQDETALLIRELGADLYLVQVTIPTGESEYLFAKKQGDQLLVRSDCKGLDPATVRGFGAEIKESGETIYDCEFKDAKGLAELGESPELWAGSPTTLQIVSVE